MALHHWEEERSRWLRERQAAKSIGRCVAVSVGRGAYIPEEDTYPNGQFRLTSPIGMGQSHKWRARQAMESRDLPLYSHEEGQRLRHLFAWVGLEGFCRFYYAESKRGARVWARAMASERMRTLGFLRAERNRCHSDRFRRIA